MLGPDVNIAASTDTHTEVRKKIDILLAFIECYPRVNRNQVCPEFHIQMLEEHYKSQIQDVAWLDEVITQLRVDTKKPFGEEVWLKNRLSELNLYSCLYVERRFDQFYKCFELYLELTQGKKTTKRQSLDDAFALEVRGKQQMSDFSEAKLGDTVVYSNENEARHIGMYLGAFLGHHYVISKFGGHNIMLHPIDRVPKSYGNVICCYPQGLELTLNIKLLESLVSTAKLPFKKELLNKLASYQKHAEQPCYLPSQPSLSNSCQYPVASSSISGESNLRYYSYCRIL